MTSLPPPLPFPSNIEPVPPPPPREKKGMGGILMVQLSKKNGLE